MSSEQAKNARLTGGWSPHVYVALVPPGAGSVLDALALAVTHSGDRD